jgi:hypothetical protein
MRLNGSMKAGNPQKWRGENRRLYSEHVSKIVLIDCPSSGAMCVRQIVHALGSSLHAPNRALTRSHAEWPCGLACSFFIFLLPAPALADLKEKVAALAPSGLVLQDAAGTELVAQNAEDLSSRPRSPRSLLPGWRWRSGR